MKVKNVRLAFFLGVLAVSFSQGCEEQDIEKQKPVNVAEFLAEVESDPTIVNEIRLGDSWRLIIKNTLIGDADDPFDGQVRYYNDLLADPEYANYKEYWTFGKEKVLMTYKGNFHEINFGEHQFKIHDEEIDLMNEMIAITYHEGDVANEYTRRWEITSITDTELVLTEDNKKDKIFNVWTFRREKF